MQSNDQNFNYAPLRRQDTEIRLLCIRPISSLKTNEIPIQCSLSTVSLNKNPKYIALSYAWGDPGHKLPISVNRKTMYISENLHEAILKLRKSYAEHAFWIDAICINQRDDAEKSWQVDLMLSIYRKAAQVLVWLGPSAEGSDELMDKFQDFGADALATGLPEFDGEELLKANQAVYDAVTPFNKFKSPVSVEGTFEDMMFRRFYGENRRELTEVFPPHAVEAFLSRAWWKRIWVLQEFSTASSVTFICGDKTISSDVLDSALTLTQIWSDAVLQMDSALLTLERVNEGIFAGFKDYIEETKSSWVPRYNTENHHKLMFKQRRLFRNNKPVALLDLLEFAGGAETDAALQASDPRDIVFALLGLSSDAKELGIKADYTKSVRQVYEETAIALVQGGWHVILCSTDVDFEAVKRKEWASWVPDWRRKFSINRPKHRAAIHDSSAGYAAGKSTTKFSCNLYVLEKPPLLELKCSVLGVIAEVKILPLSTIEARGIEPMLPLHDLSPDFMASIHEAERFATDKKHPLGYVGDDKDVVWRTLVADVIIMTHQKRTLACRTNRRARRTFRAVYRAIVEHRVRQYVMQEQLTAIHQLLQDDKDGKIKAKGLENPVNLPTTAAGFLSLFAHTVRSMLAGRALLKTTQGLLCLGPVESKPGDMIVIPYSMPTPLVLGSIEPRFSSELWGSYVGDVYVHGAMDGEAEDLHLTQRTVNFR